MANMNIDQMVEELSGWTVKDVASLVKALENSWGVSAAPVAVAGVAAAGQAAGAGVRAFENAGGFTAASTQIVELRAADFTAADNFDFCDVG